MNVVNKLHEAKVNLMMKMAVASLKTKGSIKNLAYKGNGGAFSIGEISISGDRSNSVIDFAMSVVGNWKHLDRIQVDPVKASGDGEFSLIIRNLNIAIDGESFQMEEMEISSIAEGLEFLAAIGADGFAEIQEDEEKYNKDKVPAWKMADKE